MLGGAAAAVPLIKAALPWVAASTALNFVGEQQRDDARVRALNEYNREVEDLGQRSMANAAEARNAFSPESMARAQADDEARQLEQFEQSRLPDVATGTVASGGSEGARSVGSFAANRVAAEREQAGREFRAQLGLATLSNALFGGDITTARAAALNRNNASLIDARRGKLETVDLPRADAAGRLWRTAGDLAGGVGTFKAAQSLFAPQGSAATPRVRGEAIRRGTGPSGGRWLGDTNAARPSVSLYSGRKF